MPFRDDLPAMATRRAALERELEEIRERKHELTGLDEREKQLERQLLEASAILASMPGAKPPKKSLLDNVRVASPCEASWDEMEGNGRVRFCGQCEKNVYNLSAMPRDEAEELVRSRGDLCVSLYRRADDTVITADCPAGMRIRRAKRRRLALVAVGGGFLAVGAGGAAAFAAMKASVRKAEKGNMTAMIDESAESARQRAAYNNNTSPIEPASGHKYITNADDPPEEPPPPRASPRPGKHPRPRATTGVMIAPTKGGE